MSHLAEARRDCSLLFIATDAFACLHIMYMAILKKTRLACNEKQSVVLSEIKECHSKLKYYNCVQKKVTVS